MPHVSGAHESSILTLSFMVYGLLCWGRTPWDSQARSDWVVLENMIIVIIVHTSAQAILIKDVLLRG